ncbi:MAG: DUF6273 domain-containing protein, partial [Synergistaceae bacterium]|nr:DUF6273 domain-containing protein [Synergistaceae bacterium]
MKQCFWFGALLAFCVASAGQASGASIGKADDIASGASGNTVFFGRYPQTDQGREGADPAPSGTEYVDWITDSYVNSHEAAVTRYYTIDPIEWRVLSKADGKIFLLSEKILDAKPYHTSNVPVTWEESTVRAWLNGYEAGEDADSFLDRAFASNEAGAIAQTPLVNADNPTFSTPGGNDTTDRIFFLSIAEAKKTEYGFESAGDDDDSRKSRNTGYAERIINGIPDAGDPDFWWLRSPG